MTINDTAAFLARAAGDLRKLANQTPHIAAELRRIADDCETEAARLRNGGGAA